MDAFNDMEMRTQDSFRDLESRLGSDGAPGIIWVASFPRSGSTWLRFLLSNAVFGRVRRSSDLARYIPEIHMPGQVQAALDAGTPLLGTLDNPAILVKTHFPYNARHPLRCNTVAALYLVRHPLDVVVSSARFGMHLYSRADYRALFGVDLDDNERFQADLMCALTHGATNWQFLHGWGTWQEHVYGWTKLALQQNSFPVLLVRYEDMRSQPVSSLQRILGFLGVELPAAALAAAVKASSFESLKTMEDKEVTQMVVGEFYFPEGSQRIKEGHRFLFRGEAGSHLSCLTDTQRRLGKLTFGTFLQELYPERGMPSAELDQHGQPDLFDE